MEWMPRLLKTTGVAEETIIKITCSSRREAPQIIHRTLTTNTTIKFMMMTRPIMVSIVQEYSPKITTKAITRTKEIVMVIETHKVIIKIRMLRCKNLAVGEILCSEIREVDTTFNTGKTILNFNSNLITLSGIIIIREIVGIIILQEMVVVASIINITILVHPMNKMRLSGISRRRTLSRNKATRSIFITLTSSPLRTRWSICSVAAAKSLGGTSHERTRRTRASDATEALDSFISKLRKLSRLRTQ